MKQQWWELNWGGVRVFEGAGNFKPGKNMKLTGKNNRRGFGFGCDCGRI